ncbi:MAG: hypothetical protein EOO27_10145 [Comamonadaceae bacterium]|nr:MAG: hypothetical protein EOO27_10145 [Comamonadaceae bacterium]
MADAQIQSLDRAQAEQARLRALIDASPDSYQDRFMSPEAAAALPQSVNATGSDSEGYRAWLLETRVGVGESSTTGFGRSRGSEIGVRAEYRRETLNYGEFILQSDTRYSAGDTLSGLGVLGYARERSSERFTLRNLGFPITTSTFADTSAGAVYSELTDGLSRNYRLSLGSSTVRGASTRIYSSDFDLRAGVGQRGYLAGGPYPGFERSQGMLGWLGYTQRFESGRYAAFQIDRASDVPAYYADRYSFTSGIGRKDVTSYAAAAGYGTETLGDGDTRGRLTFVGSRVNQSTLGLQDRDARGLFYEGSARTGRLRHEFGSYVAQPGLHFGDYELITGTRGAYWRVDSSASRLNWGGGVDYERSSSDANSLRTGYRRWGVSGNFQYQLDRNSSVGGSANVYDTRYSDDAASLATLGSGSRSFYGSAFYQDRFFNLPRTRLSLTVRRNQLLVNNAAAASGEELQWEQDWIPGRYETTRPEFTTTLGVARDSTGGVTRTYPTAAVQFRYWASPDFSISGNLRYTSQSGGLSTSRGLSGSLAAERVVAPGWRLGFSASLNQARFNQQQISLLAPQYTRTNDKVAYVYLRYEGNAGSAYPMAGLGGRGGSGSVSGFVYFDANRDGEAQNDERGAAGIEVLLDGRYRASTDRDGRFEFPLVTTGRHEISLNLETVPLPWGAPPDRRVSIEVPLRGQAIARVPVVRLGE